MAEPNDAFTALCRQLAVCRRCGGRKMLNGPPWREGDDGLSPCPECSGTGLDPAKVELLRGFERGVIERCAAVCEFFADERMNETPGYYEQLCEYGQIVARECAKRIRAAAIEAMGKPAGG